jgi:hypothetical protein
MSAVNMVGAAGGKQARFKTFPPGVDPAQGAFHFFAWQFLAPNLNLWEQH